MATFTVWLRELLQLIVEFVSGELVLHFLSIVSTE
jgi:hypothetical protein